MPSKKPRPCPFCGGDDIDSGAVPGVTCNNCGASGPHERSKAAAIRAWNYRPGNTINEQIGCLVDIRRVVGDPEGKLMQDELVEKIAGLVDDAALGRAVRKEIAGLEAKREAGEILSDTEDDWLNSLQGLAAGLMEVEK